jgi:hypothetical protein
MYSVDGQDRVEELRDLPQSSVGAPLPAVIADEHRTFLAYLVEAVNPGWDGRSVRMVEPGTEGEIVALVSFRRPYAHFFGPPNDEAFTGHLLAERGLHPYGVFEIHNSSWVRRLERMNAVHPHHRPGAFSARRHFIFAFHDSTFECVAERLEVEVRGGSLLSAIRELSGRLGDAAS